MAIYNYPYSAWWRYNELDQYPLLSDIWNPDTVEKMFEGTSYPTWFQEFIYDHFYYRRIGEDQITKFLRFFNRQLKYNEWQFLQYLRVQQTDFDPMVSRYIERWIQGVTTGTRDTTNQSDNSTTTETTTSNRGTDESTVKDDGIVTLNVNRTQTDNGNSETIQNTSNATDVSEITKTTVNQTVTGETETESSTKTLSSDLPQSSAYGDTGMPPNLNFSYASSQSQTDVNQSVNDNTTTNGVTDGTRSTETGEQGTVNTDVNTNSTGKTTGTDTTTTENTKTGKGTTTANGEATSVVTGGGSSTASDKTSQENDTRDWLTGRSQSPQELLNLARDYITRTNAMTWILDKLDICFLAIYD